MADDLFSVDGKRVFITGGAAGIGRMLSEGFAERGARVYTVSRKQEVLDAFVRELKDERGLDVAAAPANLSDIQSLGGVAAAAAEHFGGAIDVLINNAGATWGASIEEFPEQGWDRVFDLNVKALFFLTQQCLPYLRKAREERGDSPRVINIGSISGLQHPMDNAWSYHPAKAAVHHLSQTLAKALAGERITVNAIAPGLFPSRMTKHIFTGGGADAVGGFIPLGRTGQASDIAGTAIYLASKAGAFTTGALIAVDGGSVL